MRTSIRRHNDQKTLKKKKRGVWPRRYRRTAGWVDLTPREEGLLLSGANVTWRCRCEWCLSLDRRDAYGPNFTDWEEGGPWYWKDQARNRLLVHRAGPTQVD